MSIDDIGGLVVSVCSITSLVLSVWNLRLKLPFVDRLFPVILQIIIFAGALFPSLHGHPNELFMPMILMFLWSLFAIASSYRLYHLRVGTLRILGISQFIQSVGVVFSTIGGYAQACYFYYGHLVWNP